LQIATTKLQNFESIKIIFVLHELGLRFHHISCTECGKLKFFMLSQLQVLSMALWGKMYKKWCDIVRV